MPQSPVSPSPGNGMDTSSPPEGRALPTLSKPLPLSEAENDVASSVPTSARSSFEQVRNADSRRSSFPVEPPPSGGPREIILKAYLPRVAVYASQDTEELVRLKGIYGGLCGLLRPFGQAVSGKVGIRDSTGVSKTWDDYGVHFVPFEEERRQRESVVPGIEDSIQEGDWSRILKATPEGIQGESALDEVIGNQIGKDTAENAAQEEDANNVPSYYSLFLRKILSDRPLSPHDTFSHPVACVIAISSQTPDPISTLGDLYHDTRAERGNLPVWVNNGFLRYYVLVHDEDHDDLTASTNLFAQMKRHFGLHCHMLRLRSVECTNQEAEGNPLPPSDWLDAEEDAAVMRQTQGATAGELEQYLFDSDAAVMRTFVRELITQSIVPYMENRVTTWNDQVASRRRGVTGRLMSMGKRWTNFGSVRGRSSPAANADKDYDSVQGAYKPESNVATMHRLADHAFMLRDWKLAYSIYDLLRTDFGDDKAWHHYAAAHEMAAISLLLTGQSAGSRGRVESINQLLDTATYSFITRCSSPREASRCMILAMELYINNRGTGVKEATRWGKRLLELCILSQLVQVLLAERIVIACQNRSAYLDIAQPGAPYRRSALWSLLASESWTRLRKAPQAEVQLAKARNVYDLLGNEGEFAAFEGTQEYLDGLELRIMDMHRSTTPKPQQEPDTFVENMAPAAESAASNAAGHRHTRSMMHRRGLSQSNVLNTIGRQDDSQQAADDGFR